MRFLRRSRDGEASPPGERDAPQTHEPEVSEADPELDAEELDRELNLLREEQRRVGELGQRQQRYARFAWPPPAEGGTRRAGDPDSGSAGSGKGGWPSTDWRGPNRSLRGQRAGCCPGWLTPSV